VPRRERGKSLRALAPAIGRATRGRVKKEGRRRREGDLTFFLPPDAVHVASLKADGGLVPNSSEARRGSHLPARASGKSAARRMNHVWQTPGAKIDLAYPRSPLRGVAIGERIGYARVAGLTLFFYPLYFSAETRSSTTTTNSPRLFASALSRPIRRD